MDGNFMATWPPASWQRIDAAQGGRSAARESDRHAAPEFC
jgi:hypothetical protein